MNPDEQATPEANILKLRSHSRFLARSILLEESGSPVMVRFAVAFAALILVLFIVWSSFMRLDEIAATQGEIVPRGELVKIQHLLGGRVTLLPVVEGEFVKKGQPLLELDPQSSRLKLDELVLSQASLSASQVRLQALVDKKEPDFSVLGDVDKTIIEDQKLLYRENVLTVTSGRDVIRSQFDQAVAQLSELDREQTGLVQQSDIAEREMKLRKNLVDQGLNSQINYLGLERNLADMRGRLSQMAPQREQYAARVSELKSRLLEYDARVREQFFRELAATNADLLRLQKTISEYSTSLDYLSLRSPVDGYIHNIHLNGPGEIAEPGATLMEIVPVDRELMATVRISSRDIGHVRQGQPVMVRLTTYNSRRYGGVEGVLADVSPSAFLSEDRSGSYYKGQVKLSRSFVGRDPDRKPILPGMTLTADIKTGSKTLMEYLLKPIYSSSQHAFRER